MHHIFYDLFGLNKVLFIFVNNITNFSILPHILARLSQIFFIGNFAVYYFALCLYFYWRLRNLPLSPPKRGSSEITPLILVAPRLRGDDMDRGDDSFANTHTQFLRIYNQLVRVGLCYAIFGLSYAALKFGINLPRPFCSLPITDFITILDTTNERCLSSFPSAHVGLCVIMAYYLWPILKNYQKILALLTIILVAISRITLAMHYPSDILYSIIIAFILIFVSNKLFEFLRLKLINPIGITISRLLF